MENAPHRKWHAVRKASPLVNSTVNRGSEIADVATRSVAHFEGMRLGREYAHRSDDPAPDSRVARVYALAVEHRRVVDGYLAVFLSAWRCGEATYRRPGLPL